MKSPRCTTTGFFSCADGVPARAKLRRLLGGLSRSSLLVAPLWLSLCHFAAGAETAAPQGGPGLDGKGGAVTLAAATIRERAITEDTVWRGDVTVEGTVAVAPQATLRIEPGTTVRFSRGASSPGLLMVQGRLVATGTAESPIVFTGASARVQKGEWQGVMLLGTEKKNLLEQCRIEGASTGLEVLYSTVSLKKVAVGRSGCGGRLHDSFVTLDGCTFSECDTGLVLRESEVESYRGIVSRNGQGIVMHGGSLYLADGEVSGNRGSGLLCQGARLKITGGSMADNGSGMLLSGCEGILSGAKLTGNSEVALSLTRSRMRVTGNEIARNSGTGIRMEDGAAVAWGNAIFQNGGDDLYNAGIEDFLAPGNWWGGGDPKIYLNEGRGRIIFTPVLKARPQM